MPNKAYPWTTHVTLAPGAPSEPWVTASDAEKALDEARELTRKLNDQLRSARALLSDADKLLSPLASLLKMTGHQDEMPWTLRIEGNLYDQVLALKKKFDDGF